MPDANELPPAGDPPKPVLSKYEIVGLVVAVAIAILLAIPALKHTYTGAVLSGQSASPAPIQLPAKAYPRPLVPAR